MAETTKKATDIKVPVAEPKKKECEDCHVLKQQIENLQKSYQLKCQDYEQLLNAYRALALRYNAAGDAARNFAKSMNLSIELLFPIDKKGE